MGNVYICHSLLSSRTSSTTEFLQSRHAWREEEDDDDDEWGNVIPHRLIARAIESVPYHHLHQATSRFVCSKRCNNAMHASVIQGGPAIADPHSLVACSREFMPLLALIAPLHVPVGTVLAPYPSRSKDFLLSSLRHPSSSSLVFLLPRPPFYDFRFRKSTTSNCKPGPSTTCPGRNASVYSLSSSCT